MNRYVIASIAVIILIILMSRINSDTEEYFGEVPSFYKCDMDKTYMVFKRKIVETTKNGTCRYKDEKGQYDGYLTEIEKDNVCLTKNDYKNRDEYCFSDDAYDDRLKFDCLKEYGNKKTKCKKDDQCKWVHNKLFGKKFGGYCANKSN